MTNIISIDEFKGAKATSATDPSAPTKLLHVSVDFAKLQASRKFGLIVPSDASVEDVEISIVKAIIRDAGIEWAVTQIEDKV